MTINVSEIQVKKSAIGEHRSVDRQMPMLATGQALLAVDQFALTANNVTYAVFGDGMKYWNFFPTEDPAWGVVPVWGFGDVTESQCEGVDVGSRYYGYFPMATHLVVEPTRVNTRSFSDGAPHRAELHSVYNSYVCTSTDPAYVAEREPEQMLLRPLFTTSFLIDDVLDDNNMFGADVVILSSASSKTAYGAAFCLHRRGSVQVVGLTSERNRAFTESLGCYDRVYTYEEVGELELAPTVYVDLAGSGPTRLAVHTRLGDALTHSLIVGGTHWDDLPAAAPLPGPPPQMFFAPTQVSKRNRDWGHDGFQERIGEAWAAFLSNVVSADKPWMTVQHVHGAEALAECFVGHAAGTMSPDTGHVASF
jgi:Protein of unknown function (DUF2855)